MTGAQDFGGSAGHAIPLSNASGFYKHVETLTESQKKFVHLLLDWFRDGRRRFFFVVVSGGPGCGKTHAVVETLRFLRVNVLKMAPTALLANRIGGRTVHSTLRIGFKENTPLNRVERKLRDEEDIERCLSESDCLRQTFNYKVDGRNPLPDIIFVDELSVLPFWKVYQLARYFSKLVLAKSRKNIAMVVAGDMYQLNAVGSKHNVFDFPFENYFPTARVELSESKRFAPAYEKVMNRLREMMIPDRNGCCDESKKTGEVEEEEKKMREDAASRTNPTICEIDPFFAYVRETFPVREYVTLALLSQATRVLAFRNETVEKCNDYYIQEKMKSKPLFEFVSLKTESSTCEFPKTGDSEKSGGPLLLRGGCSAVVTENGCGRNAFNGTCLTFLDYDAETDEAVCESEENCGLTIRVGRSRYTGRIPLVPGFATTVHKVQGGTIDEKNIVMCFDGSADKNLIYTGLSRVRKIEQILAVVMS